MIRHAGRKTGTRIGLALGGGGARGFAGLRPAAVAGTSMGAVIGAGYAAGMTGAEIRAYSLDLFGRRSEVLSRIWQLRPKSVGDLITQSITRLDAERVVNAFLPASLPEDFSGLDIPFRAIATDYYGWDEAILERGPLRRAVAASAAIPGLFRPVVVDGRVLVDGGVANPLPFDRLSAECDFVVAVDVIGGPVGRAGQVPGSAEALFGAAQLFMQTITREKLRSSRPPDVLLRAPASAFRVLDFMKAAEILAAAAGMKDDVKRQIDRALAAVS
jgi:NTE family protein